MSKLNTGYEFSPEAEEMHARAFMEELEREMDFSPEEIGELGEGAGWPGDGSGEDDLADYNANEANDYMGE